MADFSKKRNRSFVPNEFAEIVKKRQSALVSIIVKITLDGSRISTLQSRVPG